MTTTVSCPSCKSTCKSADACCGSCGAALARLAVRDPRFLLPSATANDGLLAVDTVVENSGVVGAAVVLRGIDAASFPPWLVAAPERDRALVVPPGAAIPLSFVVNTRLLPPPGTPGVDNPSRFVVPLVTSLIRFDEGSHRAVRRALAIEMAMPGQAALHPTRVYARFLPVELLQKGGISQAVVVANEGGQPILIRDVRLEHDGPAVLVVVDKPVEKTLKPGTSLSIDVAFVAAPDLVVTEPGGIPFCSRLVVDVDDGQAQSTVCCHVSGVVGRGPDVVVVDNDVIQTGGRTRRAAVVVENPGDRPVRVTSLTLSDGDDGPFLSLVDDQPFVLDARARFAIELRVEPERRLPLALSRPFGERRLTLTHDGWPVDEADRVLDIPVTAELGRTQVLGEATLGIDFGTSNSSVSMFHGPSATLHALPLDRALGKEALASLLFFTGLGRSAAAVDDAFLVGAAAENAAPQNFTNLVRQLKSVVARAKDTEWNFVDEDSGQVRLVKRSTEALLVRFFGEVKRRAEDGLSALPLSFLAELGLIDTAVRFQHAVFSHPVGVDDGMIRALHDAATAVGLGAVDFETFKARHCVDEALAATLAFLYLAAQAPAAAVPIVDDERILCFDAGGGTCDVAAVAVKGLASFRQHPGQAVVDVTLLANGGDPRFGGTDIDRLLAIHVLGEVHKRKEAAGIDVDGLKRALFFPGFESFRRARGDAGTEADRRLARQIFHQASDVLRAAERIKKTLSDEPQASFIAPLEDWPRSRAFSAATDPGRVEVVVTRKGFEEVMGPALSTAAQLIHPVVAAAGWQMADVTTLLFTGQTSKIPALRKAVLNEIHKRRGATPPPFVVEPGLVAAFDLKRCVAQGAAILGDSRRHGGGWLTVSRRSAVALSAAVQVRRGPLLVDVKGLEAGAPLPATAVLTFAEPAQKLVLYVRGVAAWEAEFAATGQVAIVVAGEHNVEVVVDGATLPARRVQP